MTVMTRPPRLTRRDGRDTRSLTEAETGAGRVGMAVLGTALMRDQIIDAPVSFDAELRAIEDAEAALCAQAEGELHAELEGRLSPAERAFLADDRTRELDGRYRADT